jgi:hypothetical protein
MNTTVLDLYKITNFKLINDYLNSFEPYYVSFIVIVGLIGNLFLFSMFVFTKMK